MGRDVAKKSRPSDPGTAPPDAHIRGWGRLSSSHAFSRLPVLRHYGTRLMRDIWGYTAVILGGVVAIFLCNALLFELLPKVLEYKAGVVTLVVLLALSVPQGLFLALPLGMLIATYMVFLERRERAEFMVLAGMGYGPHLLSTKALLVGAIGFAASTILSGWLEPLATYQVNEQLFAVASNSVRMGQIPSGRMYEFGDTSVTVSNGTLGDGNSGMFVQLLDGGHFRVVQADRTLGVGAAGTMTGLILTATRVADFDIVTVPPSGQGAEEGPGCSGCGGTRLVSPVNLATLNQFGANYPVADLPKPASRAQSPNLQTTPELLAQTAPNADLTRELGSRLARSLLCLLVPLLGLVAVTLTRARTLLVALPGAAAIVVSASFFDPLIIGQFSGAGVPAVAEAALTVACFMAIAGIWLIRHFHAGVIVASQGRA